MNIENFIGIQERAFSSIFCKKAIDHYENLVKSGFGVQNASLQNKINRDGTTVFLTDNKTISLDSSKELTMEFNNIFWNSIYPEYVSKYPTLESTKVGINQFKIQKTNECQGYHLWHYESSTRDSATRLLVFMLYLNTVEAGETEFLYQGRRVAPKEGTVVIFPAGFTHSHRGNPPVGDSKYIINGWVEV